jgi:hypothetical protein
MPAIDVDRITTEECARRLSRRLRQLVGPGRVWSYRGVSNLTGIDERTLRAYCAGTACPNLTKWHRLLSVLGPAITVDLQLMLGWTPRSGLRLPPGAVDLQAVAKDLRELLRVIDIELAKSGDDAAALQDAARVNDPRAGSRAAHP